MATWWRSLTRRYRFGPQHLRVLACAAEAWDRKEEARVMLANDGLTTTNREGDLRPHPAIAIERDSRLAFVRAVRELAVDDDLPAADTRPPRLKGYKGRR
jgi:phage terminase small subunit